MGAETGDIKKIPESLEGIADLADNILRFAHNYDTNKHMSPAEFLKEFQNMGYIVPAKAIPYLKIMIPGLYLKEPLLPKIPEIFKQPWRYDPPFASEPE